MTDMEESQTQLEDVKCEEKQSSSHQDDELSTDESSVKAAQGSPVTSLPSPSGQKVQLRRSLSFPLISSRACHVCAGFCVCPYCPKTSDDETDQVSPTCCKDVPRARTRRQSGGSIRACRRHSAIGSLQDSVPDSLASLEDAYFFLDTEPSVSAVQDTVLFERSELELHECQVCLVDTMSRLRPCCKMPTCDGCLQRYIREKVTNRILCIRCPNPACSSCICREEILHFLSRDLFKKFLRFLAENNSSPDQKTCPNCNLIAKFEQDVVIGKHKTQPDEQHVACPCGLLWCFRCHAPWHKNVSCKQFQKGDRLLREWAKESHRGQLNANKCPKCKVYIQRSSGCDSMMCSQCQTAFCYRCGGRFYRIKFFGNHFSRFSVFGCKYRLMPNEPVKRKAIRGAILGCKLAAAPVAITLAAGVGSIVVVALAPAYVTYRVRKEYKHRQHERRRRLHAKLYRQYLDYTRTLHESYELQATQILRPRSATLVELPPFSWQPVSKDSSDTKTECV